MHRADDIEHRADDLEHRANDTEHKADDIEHGADDIQHRADDKEHRADDKEHGADDIEHRADDLCIEHMMPKSVSLSLYICHLLCALCQLVTIFLRGKRSLRYKNRRPGLNIV